MLTDATYPRQEATANSAGVTLTDNDFIFNRPDGRTTTIPNHPGRDLARPLIREILREIELTPEQFQRQLKGM